LIPLSILTRGGPEEAWRRKIHIRKGKGWQERGGGGIHLSGDGPAEGVAEDGGLFFGHLFGLEGWTFM